MFESKLHQVKTLFKCDPRRSHEILSKVDFPWFFNGQKSFPTNWRLLFFSSWTNLRFRETAARVTSLSFPFARVQHNFILCQRDSHMGGERGLCTLHSLSLSWSSLSNRLSHDRILFSPPLFSACGPAERRGRGEREMLCPPAEEGGEGKSKREKEEERGEWFCIVVFSHALCYVERREFLISSAAGGSDNATQE